MKAPALKLAPAQEMEIDGRKYTVQALNKNMSKMGFVGKIAQQVFHDELKRMGINTFFGLRHAAETQAIIEKSFDVAEQFRLELKKREMLSLDAIEAETRKSAGRIILPDAGMMREHMLPGTIPNLD